jgi:hypothetical protein
MTIARFVSRLVTGVSVVLLTIGLCGCLVLVAGSYKNTCDRDGPFPPDSVHVVVDSEEKRSLGVWPLWRQCTWLLEGGGEITAVDSSMIPATLTLYSTTAVGAGGLAYSRVAKRSVIRRAHAGDDAAT